MKNNYEIRGETTAIFIKYKDQELETLIDTSDLPMVMQFPCKWCPSKSASGFYVSSRHFKKTFRLHRYIMDAPSDMVVDHINHNTLDNRRNNLRVVTVGQNNQNTSGARSDNSSSGIRNINWSKQYQKWHVKLNVDGRSRHIGYFEDLDKAKEMAEKARAILLPYSFEALTVTVDEYDAQKLDEKKLVSTNKSGVEGIHFNEQRGKWTVQLFNTYLGLYKEFSEALEILERAKVEGIDTIKRELSSKMSSDSISGIKHVIRNNDKFQVVIVKNKARHYFGTFNTVEEAAEVAKQARKTLNID